MEESNISFTSGDNKFNFRVAAFITHKNNVLVEKAFDFYNLPGGRVHMGESSQDALLRELREEMNFTPKKFKLIQVCENFFDWMGKHQQEMLYIYHIPLDETSPLVKKNNFKCADNEKEIFSWRRFDEIKDMKCLPECIYDLVERNDHSNITHSITR